MANNMNLVYLMIGGNEGNRNISMTTARKMIGYFCGHISKKSSVYETAAWGINDQPAYLNQALEIETKLRADELLTAILKIELEMGRKRTAKYGPRLIDIDILFFNNEIIDVPGLRIPHPELQNRRFVLEPLHQIAPLMVHPVLKKTIEQLLALCPDLLAVNKIN